MYFRRENHKTGSHFYFYTSETIPEVSVISDKIVRFRYAPNDNSYGIKKDVPDQFYVIGIGSRNAEKEFEEEYAQNTAQAKLIQQLYDKGHQV